MLPSHGRIDCNKCFSDKGPAWGDAVLDEGGWRLEHNPCAWGSSDPEVLVLGFSKGTNQTAVIKTAPFEDIPFKGMRPNLSRILARLRLLPPGAGIERHIHAEERDFAFGSMIRCSISKDGQKAGEIVNAAASDPFAARVIQNCTNRFFRDLPARLRVVVMLSNDDEYVDACFTRFHEMDPAIRRINQVAYGNGSTVWVHVVHPSGSSGRHIGDWLEGARGRQAEKRQLALAALGISGDNGSGEAIPKVTPRGAPGTPTPRAARPAAEQAERLSHRFCFLLHNGETLYPVRMRNRDSGRIAFRVSKGGTGGNTKEIGIEVEDEDEMARLVLGQGYAVRMRSRDGRTHGLYKIGQRAVREVKEL